MGERDWEGLCWAATERLKGMMEAEVWPLKGVWDWESGKRVLGRLLGREASIWRRREWRRVLLLDEFGRRGCLLNGCFRASALGCYDINKRAARK